MRDGKRCGLCGTKIFNWQEDEYNVFDGLCPECSLEAEDYFGGDLDDEILEQLAAL